MDGRDRVPENGALPDDDDEDPSIVILNPFWARTPEEHGDLFPGSRLTVKPPSQPSTPCSQRSSPMPLSSELLMLSDQLPADWGEFIVRTASLPRGVEPSASGESPGELRKLASQSSSGSQSRRPLVKQKKHCQSVEDVGQPPAPVTINVSGATSPYTCTTSRPSRSPSWDEKKPSVYVTGGSERWAAPSRQQSVESRVSSAAPSAAAAIAKGKRGSSSSCSKTGPIEDGGLLPAAFEPVPVDLYGKPLQEIDPTVRDKVSL